MQFVAPAGCGSFREQRLEGLEGLEGPGSVEAFGETWRWSGLRENFEEKGYKRRDIKGAKPRREATCTRKNGEKVSKT